MSLGRTVTLTSAEAAAHVSSPANATWYTVFMCGSGVNAKLPSAAVTVLEMTVKSVSSACSRASVTATSRLPGACP